ncbi:MAG: hypothetical protein WBM81_14185 [Sedimenticolaceae bacterium]
MKAIHGTLFTLCVLVATGLAVAQEQSAGDLARKAQNPIASMISVPIQSNINYDWGPEGETFAVTNIQPVLPFKLNDDWNVVTRTILPIVSQPGLTPGQDRKWGTSDTLFTAFFVPADSGDWIWGVGPAVQLPTTSNSRLGNDEWGAGASLVALSMPGRWVVGGLVSNVWGIDEDPGNEVNLFTMQPFANYNFDQGWYFTFAPIISANWEAPGGQKWTVPLGGGIGKIFKIGSQAMNAQLHYYYNVEKPDFVGGSNIRLQLQFMFPR